MVTTPLISIIIPCYNQAQYLDEAIGSLIKQTYTNWECIIVNDGSIDNTIDVALSLTKQDPRLRLINIENRGVSAARNIGIEHSRGDFIQFLDADDLIEVEKFKHQVELLSTRPDIDITYASSRYFYDDNPTALFPCNSYGIIPTVDTTLCDYGQTELLLQINICTMCAPLYRKKIFNDGIRFTSCPFEDWLMHIECSLAGFRFHYQHHEKALSLIRVTSNSQMKSHINQNTITGQFNQELSMLLTKYNYLNHKIVSLKNDKMVNVKKIIRNLLPPIIYKAGSALIRKH